MPENENPYETIKETHASDNDANNQPDMEALDVEQLSKIVGGEPGEQCW